MILNTLVLVAPGAGGNGYWWVMFSFILKPFFSSSICTLILVRSFCHSMVRCWYSSSTGHWCGFVSGLPAFMFCPSSISSTLSTPGILLDQFKCIWITRFCAHAPHCRTSFRIYGFMGVAHPWFHLRLLSPLQFCIFWNIVRGFFPFSSRYWLFSAHANDPPFPA